MKPKRFTSDKWKNIGTRRKDKRIRDDYQLSDILAGMPLPYVHAGRCRRCVRIYTCLVRRARKQRWEIRRWRAKGVDLTKYTHDFSDAKDIDWLKEMQAQGKLDLPPPTLCEKQLTPQQLRQQQQQRAEQGEREGDEEGRL
ncbi:unnamed protein product [Rangifer tarandus platyrhynchus]|uniref:Uncharacterized protein n=1 Tax=Rangifer tarandus platyrhynchus TaxID=3082113 RepID=A0ABN8XKT9_RANTA|nr:unnamed protein product [Rangifer tarandus platyrhynchus]